ncbi:MAG: histidine kinase [Dermatophilaceae bacterium]
MVPGGLHPPTAAVVLAVVIVLAVGWMLWRRHRERTHGFLSDVDRATYETLHTVSLAAKPLREGLTEEGATRAARHLLEMLHASAVAVQGVSRTLAWVGAGEHHRLDVREHTASVLRDGQTVVIPTGRLSCDDLECPIRSAVIAPLVVDDLVVGALAAYAPESSAGLARATEEIAGWASSQLQLAELGRERTRAMEAELRALRAQISPHFVYNSLAAIASFVRTDPERARELLLEFADFTRYALRKGGAFTTLSEELRNVERYLVLEQARFGDRLSVSLLIAPEVLPVQVPYLAVQPLVENAVRHGLAGKTTPGTLTLEARDLGAEAEIVIEDDGIGADPERVRAALDGGPDGENVGLGNVDARLRQVYGDEYGLVIETAPGAGTKVSFRVPKFAPSLHQGGATVVR